MTRALLTRVALLASAAALVVLAFAPRVAARLDLPIYDLLLRAEPGPSSARVSVVAIDDASLAAVGRWPWGRDRIAELIGSLRRLGASTIAVDMLLAEPEAQGTGTDGRGAVDTDAVLADALADDVVLGYAMTFSTASPAGTPLHPLHAAVVDRGALPSPPSELFHPGGCVCPLQAFAGRTSRSGFLNVGVDADGLLRRTPLLMSLGDELYPSLALAAILPAGRNAETTIEAHRSVPLRLNVEGRSLALGADGTLALRLPARERPLDHISAAEVLGGRVDSGRVRGRIVFIGVTALGLQDTVATPVDRQSSGVDVQAAAAANLADGRFIAPFPGTRLSEGLAILALSLLAAMAIDRWGLRRGALVSLAAMALFWLACGELLARSSLYLSPLLPTLATAGVVGAAGVLRARTDRSRAEHERRRREQAQDFVTRSLTSLVEIRDHSTGQHARRTQGYSRLLLRPLASRAEFRHFLTPERIELVSRLAPLHDIGKIGIRDAVLNKPAPLNAEEMAEMRLHPVYGFDTISRAEVQAGVDSEDDRAILQIAKDIVYTHHERWDGGGYPRGLRGEEIPLAGRVMAVVDVYDALVEPRPYRRQLPHSEAVAIILAGRGTQFDPQVVEAFMTAAPSFAAMRSVLPAGVPAETPSPNPL